MLVTTSSLHSHINDLNLEPGESIKVEPGAMVAQSFDLSIKTGMGGGKGVGGFLRVWQSQWLVENHSGLTHSLQI